MRVFTVVLGLLSTIALVFAAPPPDYERVLVVVDETNTDISVDSIANPLKERGFEVTTVGIKDHPKLYEYGERLVDNVVIVPGKVKALGSTLRAVDILNFMELGGNVVALSTPKYNPAALREAASQLGIEVSARGIEYQNNFNTDLLYPHPHILHTDNSESVELAKGASVAKLSEGNPLLLGLAQAPYTAYAWNPMKDTDDDGEVIGAVSELFGEGSDLFIAAALQSTRNARFVWIGDSELLTKPDLAEQITGWAFQELGRLRLVSANHTDAQGESHLHYAVEQDLKYCASIEQWVPELKAWTKYSNIEDVQIEFKMLDPYYRLNLGPDACVEFKTPEQYGMFTFNLDYQRPGLSTLQDKQVVTIRHRANNEWDRSWSITNSWVYLSGVSITVISFLVFVVLYVYTDAGDETTAAPATTAAIKQETSTPAASVGKAASVGTSDSKKSKSQKRK